jgi:hypothetical protein
VSVGGGLDRDSGSLEESLIEEDDSSGLKNYKRNVLQLERVMGKKGERGREENQRESGRISIDALHPSLSA